jgi:hypothetical protein
VRQAKKWCNNWGVMSCLKRYDMFAARVKHATNLQQRQAATKY